jgi:protocatechuate 3,4-dioxygenase beta subunit
VTGRILDTSGEPVPNATIETWETDGFGFYDTQYADREGPDCRGRLKSDSEGRYGFRAVVPVAYPIPGDVCASSSFKTFDFQLTSNDPQGTCRITVREDETP